MIETEPKPVIPFHIDFVKGASTSGTSTLRLVLLAGATQFAHLVDFLRAEQLPKIRDYDATMGSFLHDLLKEGLLQLDLDRQGQTQHQVSTMRNLVAYIYRRHWKG